MAFIFDINQFTNLCNFKIKTNSIKTNICKHFYYEFLDNDNYRSYIELTKKQINNLIFIHINFIRVSSKYRGQYFVMYMIFYFFIHQCHNNKYKYKMGR